MTGLISTVVIIALTAGAIVLAIHKLWKDKKNGKTCCGGGCNGCCGCGDKKKKG